jgi:hypothetical protein
MEWNYATSLAVTPPLLAAALAVCAVLAHRRPAFHPRMCGLRGGAAATAALIGCWDQGRGARFVGRDRLLPLHRRVRCAAHLVVMIYDLLLASILGICGSDASVAYPFPYSGIRAILHSFWSGSLAYR